MPLSLILFDLDETLFDHEHSSRSALDRLRALYPVLRSVSLEELAAVARNILASTHARVLTGELSIEAARIERLRQLFRTFGAELDEANRHEALTAYVAAYRNSRRPVAGALELLETLATEHVIGIVTNNFRLEQEAKLVDCGLQNVIDFMITSEETGIAKPDAAIFSAALDAGRAAPENTVMVGDNWHVDVVGALNAGIRPVWFNRHQRPSPAPETVPEVHSFEPLESALSVILGHC